MLNTAKAKGFTLLELIFGMVLLALALTLISSVLAPLYVKTVDPWHQLRATQLAQGLMDDILARSFDENSSRSGALLRCGETGAPACSTTLGAEGESRENYDDVDDYHGLTLTGDQITNVLNEQLLATYQGYQVSVNVQYAGTELGLANQLAAKRIDIRVTPPASDVLIFSAYRGNW